MDIFRAAAAGQEVPIQDLPQPHLIRPNSWHIGLACLEKVELPVQSVRAKMEETGGQGEVLKSTRSRHLWSTCFLHEATGGLHKGRHDKHMPPQTCACLHLCAHGRTYMQIRCTNLHVCLPTRLLT